MNIHYKTFLLVIFFFCVSTQVVARSSIDARVEYENWNSGINGKSTATLFGLGGSTTINEKWSLSAGFVMGEHSFEDTSSASADRQDFDMVAAYKIMTHVQVYGGYRLIRTKYDNQLDSTRSFTELTHGLGVGIAGYHLIIPKIIAYGRLGMSGLYSSLDSSATDDNGTGFGMGFEAGIIYQFLAKTNVGLSLKQQSMVINYKNDSDKWNHNYLRFGLSLSHTF